MRFPPHKQRDQARRVGANCSSLLGAGLVALLLALPQTDAGFSGATDTTANAWASDTLSPPTALAASSGATITINWTATTDTYATGHRILRSTSPGGPYTQIAQITPRTTVTHIESPPGGTYYYVARAYYFSWESVNSNETTATVPIISTSVSFGPDKDTFVDQQFPTTNYGSSAIAMVRTWVPSNNTRVLAAFDVSSIPPGSTIDSAVLTLCPRRAEGLRFIDVNRVTAAWSENVVVWNSQPTVVPAPTATLTQPASTACVSTPNLASDLQAWVDGTPNHGWRLTDTVEDDVKNRIEYRSREDPLVAERPRLVVTYHN